MSRWTNVQGVKFPRGTNVQGDRCQGDTYQGDTCHTTMAAVMAVLRMNQASEQSLLKFIAQLKAAARLCKFGEV